jgi:hypothetical protein
VLGVLTVTLNAPGADEAVPLPDLLKRLAGTSARVESMLAKASFTAKGRIETVDGDGHVTEVRESVMRFLPRPGKHDVDIVQYAEDGVDRTAEAREKAVAGNRKKPDPDEALHMPFLASEQPKYVFSLGESDPRDRRRVRVHFRARRPALTLWNGSAWVQADTGEVLTMGAAQSKTAMFVDHFTGTVEFGAHTPEGPAVSKATFEGAGGFLFFRKRFRGWAVVSDYSVP